LNDLPLEYFVDKLREDLEYIMEQSLSDLGGIETHSPAQLSVPTTSTDINERLPDVMKDGVDERLPDAMKDGVVGNGSVRFIARLFGTPSQGESHKEKKS
jgi:hypothetical protein